MHISKQTSNHVHREEEYLLQGELFRPLVKSSTSLSFLSGSSVCLLASSLNGMHPCWTGETQSCE